MVRVEIGAEQEAEQGGRESVGPVPVSQIRLCIRDTRVARAAVAWFGTNSQCTRRDTRGGRSGLYPLSTTQDLRHRPFESFAGGTSAAAASPVDPRQARLRQLSE
jgi:hypothetical protein